MVYCKTAITLVRYQWIYYNLALSPRFHVHFLIKDYRFTDIRMLITKRVNSRCHKDNRGDRKNGIRIR